MERHEIKNIPYPSVSEETIVINQSGLIVFLSEKACSRFGYNSYECVDKDVTSLFPELDLSTVEEGILIQQYGKHRKGNSFPLFIRMNSFILKDAVYFLIVIHNVKDRTKLSKELSQPLSELVDLKFALDKSTIVAFTDANGIIKYVNEKFCEVSKYEAEEVIGKTHRVVNSGYHSKEFFELMWATITAGKVWSGNIKNRAKDGSYYWVDTTIVPFLNEDGAPYQYLAIRKEITEHKQAVTDLKQSLQELMDFKFALDASSILAITDQRGVIHYVNDKFCKISKFSREELIGMDHRIVNSGYHSREFFQQMWGTISSGKVWKGEIRNRAKDGNLYWVDTTIVPFLTEEGKPYQYLAIRYEITKRKKIEEELKRMATRMIEVQEEERKRLSRNLHDGIGQNVYSHLITIQRLQAEMDHPLLEQMKQEATELIEEIREISWELRPSVIDDLGLVPAIRSYLSRYSEHYNIDVHFDCALHKRLDTNKEITIYRIIQESLTNIRKYAEVNEASVTIREQGEIVTVVIEDKGKGFDVAKNTRGVGLFSMEERAKAVGCELRIQSSPGIGTMIILEVPTTSWPHDTTRTYQ
ncbi:PAS domain-containing sensor histidine kinase [Mesobacillus harenae]|uniref:sensor histidine kinase n=1 Tax=Mesobacillus harenae TaxID=2213203 RepID=UPI001580CA61|nr:PAS domain S-box protein [Mesobacillus harenae]